MRPPSLSVLTAALLPLVAPFFTSTLAAQQQPILVAHAQAVVEDVVVTDRQGQPVTGLTAADFKLLEDGKPQTINYFEPHTAAPLSTRAAALPAMPPHVYTNVPTTPPQGSVDILLLDALDTTADDYANSRAQVKQFLDHAHPGAQLAIFVLGQKLYCLHGFTTDAASLTTSLSSRLATQAAGDGNTLAAFATTSAALAPTDGAIAISRSTPGASPVAAGARADGEANYQQIETLVRAEKTLDALDYLAHYLSGIPGRKNLIWFSSNFPAYLAPDPANKDLGEILDTLTPRIHRTTNNLGTARIAVYPAFAGGIMNEHVVDSDMAIPANAGMGGHFGSGSPIVPYQAQSSARASILSSMNLLADSTGGHAIFNTNDLDAATQRVIADVATFYTLSYSPTDHKQNGHLRRIEIKLTDHHSGTHLDYRHGYYADTKSTASPTTNKSPLQPLLAYGLPSVSQVLYGLRLDSTPLPLTAADPTATRVPLTPLLRYSAHFLIRTTDIDLNLATDGTRTGRLEIALLAYNQHGQPLKVQDETYDLHLTAPQYASAQAAGLPITLHLDLPTTALQLKTGVYDLQSSKAGTLAVALPQ